MDPLVIGGVRIPRVVYGTAWKEERTGALVRDALAAGFRGIDTANQRKHYHEAGVGEGLRASGVPREEIFLQTKFTFARGQDHRLPFDPRARVAEQVRQSLASSLEHLGVDRVDALVLHGPTRDEGLGEADVEAWRAMEAEQRAGRARLLGLSNVTREQVAAFDDIAEVKPSIVQSRTLAFPRADADTRAYCAERGLAYQGFSLLTGAPGLLAHPVVRAAAAAASAGATSAQVVLRYWLQRGVVALSGTSSREHMAHDLAVARDEVELLPREVDAITRLLEGGA